MAYPAFKIGPLPVAQINKALDLELDDGDVWVSKAAHQHIAEDHPDDYPLIIAHIVEIIRDPTFAGQDPKHGKNFYLVRMLPVDRDRNFAMVAIGLEMTQYGTYSVRSAYAISKEDVDTRTTRGSLKRIMPLT